MGKKGRRKAQQSPSEAPEHVTDKEVQTLCQKIFEIISLETPVLPVKQWEEHLKLREMVEKIRGRQADQTLFEKSEHSRKDHIASFTQWFNENGGKAEHVLIDDFGQQGLGLKAASDIKAGELFITIPRKLTISAETARNSELGPLIEKDNILRVMQNACLVLHVYCEKLKKSSFWKPYLDILPTSYSTTLYFTVEEMQALKGSPAFGEALKLYRNIARQYAYLYQRLQQVCPETGKLPLRRNFTFDDHRWAVSTVITRQNKIPSTTGEPTLALIPMWDMCNHCHGTITTGYDMTEDSCKSLSVKDFKAGEQVCIFYGERSNADLLVHNGFVFEDNIHDKVGIQLGVSKSDPLFQKKEKLLSTMKMTASSHWYSIPCGDDPIGPELLTFLRVFSMGGDELNEWLEKASENIVELNKLSAVYSFVRQETEIKCWQFIETRLSLLLGLYKKIPDAEERELLKSAEISNHKKLCIQLKRAERRVLEKALKYVSTTRNKSAETRLETDRNCDTESDKTQSNTTLSDGMEDTTSAAGQLCINGD